MQTRNNLIVRTLSCGLLAFALSACGGGGGGGAALTGDGTSVPPGGGTGQPATGSTTVPLHVKTSESDEEFNLTQRWRSVIASRNACREYSGMPALPDIPATTEEVKGYFSKGEESFYAGDRYASYEYTRQAAVGADCGVWLFTQWRAKASVGCSMYASGGSPLKISDPEGPVSLSDESNGPTCVGEKRQPLHKDTTVHLVRGYACMYVGESNSLTHGLSYSTGDMDRCLYAKVPFYNSNDRLPVTVTTRPDSKRVAAYEAYKSSPDALIIPLYYTGVATTVPELIQENAVIEPARFTKQAVLDWINQPQRKLIAP